MRRAAIPVIAVGLAGLAVWLWQAQLPGPVPHVAAAQVFTAAQIERARSYRDPQYLLALVALLVPPVAAWLLVWNGSERLALGRRAWMQAGSAAFLTAVITSAAVLPIGYIDHVRAHNRGLDLQSSGGWLGTALVTLLGTALLVAVVYVIAWLIARRAPVPWLAVGLAAWAAVIVAATLQPLVWDPVQLSTSPLPAGGSAAAIVKQLEGAMDVHPRSVTVADAGSRTTEENAFVDGVGPTQRVVIYDTSLAHMSTPELRALIAHELGHIKREHTLKGVLWFGVLALPSLWIIWRVLDPYARRRYADGLLDPRATVLVLAGVLSAVALLTPVENLISRRDEAEADWAGLRATGDGAAMASLQRHLALTNLANPVPPKWAVWLEFDHPPTMERIAVGRAHE